MTIQIKPTGSALGAEILGADLTRPLDDTALGQIRTAFDEYEVIYFRGQALTDEDQIRFTARFGELRKLKLESQSHVQHPEIFVVSNIVREGKPNGSYDAGSLWHTDSAHLGKPHAISALRALEVPMQNGRTLGDTHFTSASGSGLARHQRRAICTAQQCLRPAAPFLARPVVLQGSKAA